MSTKEALLREQEELQEQLALLKKEQDLRDRLADIRKKIDNQSSEPKSNGTPHKTMTRKKFPVKKETVKAEGLSKGFHIWDDYIIKVLETMGGKHKTPGVIEYVIKANPDIPERTIINAITGKLSKLYLEKRILADTSARSQGYDYYAKPHDK